LILPATIAETGVYVGAISFFQFAKDYEMLEMMGSAIG